MDEVWGPAQNTGKKMALRMVDKGVHSKLLIERVAGLVKDVSNIGKVRMGLDWRRKTAVKLVQVAGCFERRSEVGGDGVVDGLVGADEGAWMMNKMTIRQKKVVNVVFVVRKILTWIKEGVAVAVD